jgi:FKBP-type peptidyl-prolyl cis-trans isomerase FkpA
MNKMRFSFFFLAHIIICVFLVSCGSNEQNQQKDFDETQLKNQFIKANKQVVVKESDEMDYYQKSHQMPFIKTTTGIRYYVYKPSAKGDSIKTDDIVKINYTLSLLDGTVCYSSNTGGVKEIKVGMEDVEVGLHKALPYLKNGDKALILIPSHLAHGLLGDMKKIPPQSPILYDVEILSVKHESIK